MRYDWDPAKNDLLKATRKISFESVVIHPGRGDLWQIADHPHQTQHPGQQPYFVIIDQFIHIVSFEVREEVIWLLTILPSRKATSDYRKEKAGGETP